MKREAELLFHELADLSPEERANYLRQRQMPADLCAEVELLLRFDSETDDWLLECVADCANQALDETSEAAEIEHCRCGPYKLVRVLGRGGMGTVYLARRADGEVEQLVAIKLLRYGNNEPAFRDRFLRERQILATLEHPGIARLLDAGHTADGQPYLVMDYIDGTPIDAYAEPMDLRGTLMLFLQVCEAVSYAHRNLIIHRDLKPSNILVDRAGRPKLLDFGIAKILDSSEDETQTRELLLTPGYASPEQVRGGTHTTATDVYALGAVLYRLLTGRFPHELSSRNPADLESAICSRETPPARSLKPGIPKDLDLAIGKALRKEPDERYTSVDAFADDLRAFMEWRPVSARSGSAWYRIRKFAQRYRLAVAVASIALAGLWFGLYSVNRERAIAQRRFLEVRQLANKWIDLDRDLRGWPGTITARNRIVSTSLEYLAAMSAEVRGDQSLAIEIATAYLKVARVQGVPTDSNLGQFAQAEASLSKADGLVESVLATAPRNRRALLTSARIAHDRMILASLQDRREDVAAHTRKVTVQLDRLVKQGDLDASERKEVALLYQNLELAFESQRLYDDSRQYRRRARELLRPGDLHAGWGSNEFGQLGSGSFAGAAGPAQSTILSDVVSVAAGWFHSLALKSDGTVWAWGKNSNGELGIGSNTGSNVPVEVRGLRNVVAIGRGYSHSLAIKSDGTVWAWGKNLTGQLGNGDNTDSTTPVEASGLKNVVAVSGGGAHSLAVRADGTVWAWGYNSNGQLGRPPGTHSTVPIQVSGIYSVAVVAAGGAHSLAVKDDGTVWTWGGNAFGALGSGSDAGGSSIPVQVVGLRNVIAAAAGDWYSLALKDDGSVWAWGRNVDGLLGNGTNTPSNRPVRVAGLSGVIAISTAPAVRGGHCLALKADGTVWAWGSNIHGELGGRAPNSSTVPVEVAGVGEAVGIGAGGYHNLAIASNAATSDIRTATLTLARKVR